MENFEIQKVTDNVNDLTDQIIRAQQTLKNINNELDRNSFRPFEQDRIYRDHYDQIPSNAREHQINGVTISTRILHQTGTHSSDISGADLLYEIEGVKFLIVQYKSPDGSGRVTNDLPQLNNLIASCPVNCKGKDQRRINGLCGSWYNITDNSGDQYMQACEANKTFGVYNSRYKSKFSPGLTQNTFVELFALCRVGAPTSIESIQNYIALSLAYNRIIFPVNQFGQF